MSEALKHAVKKYIALRNEKKRIKDRHAEELRPLNDAMIKLEAAVQKFLQSQGVDSAKTPVGTAYLSRTSRAKVTDWPVLRDFVKEHDLLDILEHRVSKDAIEEYAESTGELPPGVDITVEVNTRFRT